MVNAHRCCHFSVNVTLFVNPIRYSIPNDNRTFAKRCLSVSYRQKHNASNTKKCLCVREYASLCVCCNRCICDSFSTLPDVQMHASSSSTSSFYYVQHVVIMIIVGVHFVLWTTIALLCCKVPNFTERASECVFVSRAFRINDMTHNHCGIPNKEEKKGVLCLCHRHIC